MHAETRNIFKGLFDKQKKITILQLGSERDLYQGVRLNADETKGKRSDNEDLTLYSSTEHTCWYRQGGEKNYFWIRRLHSRFGLWLSKSLNLGRRIGTSGLNLRI
jgi:hypothetical protein